MAGKLFVGFDISKISNLISAPGFTTPAQDWARIQLPAGVYHNKGAATQDLSFGPPANSGGGASTGCLAASTRGVAGLQYGPRADAAVVASSTYPAAISPPSYTTRTQLANNQGFQLAFIRSIVGIGNEFWMTFDFTAATYSAATFPNTWEPATTWGRMFSWGDITITCKETTYAAGSHTAVFSLRNAGTEIATISVPAIPTSETWMFMKLHVKLDGSTGIIEASINGIAQSVPYTGQNTVSVTSLAAATIVYFGGAVWDNGTAAYCGNIDNVYVDDAAYPAGRPEILSFTALADDSLSDFEAFGTGATTVVAALATYNDGIAARSRSSAGVAILTQTPPSTTLQMTDVLGVELVAKSVTNRSGTDSSRRLEIGYSLSGVQTMGTIARGTPLVYDSNATPPGSALSAKYLHEQIFTKSGGSLMTKTELATMKIVLKSSSP